MTLSPILHAMSNVAYSLPRFFSLKSLIFRVVIAGCYYHLVYAFESECALYSSLNVKELLTQNRRNIWNLSDSNRIRNFIHLVSNWTLEHISIRCIWLHVITISRTRLRMNLHSIVLWLPMNSLTKTGTLSDLFWERTYFTFRQLLSVDWLWEAYVTWQQHRVKSTIQLSAHNTVQLIVQFG